MTLLPRHIDRSSQNVLCKHLEGSGTAEAGAIVALSGSNLVGKITHSGNRPYGMLGQKVKANAAGLPQNFEFPGELGNSDARLGDPVLLYHSGIFETTHYDCAAGVTAGSALYAKVGDGKLTNSGTAVAAPGGTALVCAWAQNTLSTTEAAAGENLIVKLVLA